MKKLLVLVIVFLLFGSLTVYANQLSNEDASIVLDNPSQEVEGKLLVRGTTTPDIKIMVKGNTETIWYDVNVTNGRFENEIWLSQAGNYLVSIMKNSGNNKYSKEITFEVSNTIEFDKYSIPSKHVESTNESILEVANEITEGKVTDIEKAKAIYDWVVKNIQFDKEKSQKALKSGFDNSFGAVHTLQTKSGICYDFSALYCALGRANGLKVKMVRGEVMGSSCCWNEVFDSDRNVWFNVDSALGANTSNLYFDTEWFEADHKKTSEY